MLIKKECEIEMFSFLFSFRQIPLDIGKETLFTLRPGICYVFISDTFLLFQANGHNDYEYFCDIIQSLVINPLISCVH